LSNSRLFKIIFKLLFFPTHLNLSEIFKFKLLIFICFAFFRICENSSACPSLSLSDKKSSSSCVLVSLPKRKNFAWKIFLHGLNSEFKAELNCKKLYCLKGFFVFLKFDLSPYLFGLPFFSIAHTQLVFLFCLTGKQATFPTLRFWTGSTTRSPPRKFQKRSTPVVSRANSSRAAFSLHSTDIIFAALDKRVSSVSCASSTRLSSAPARPLNFANDGPLTQLSQSATVSFTNRCKPRPTTFI
jgi:hypothetical protein